QRVRAGQGRAVRPYATLDGEVRRVPGGSDGRRRVSHRRGRLASCRVGSGCRRLTVREPKKRKIVSARQSPAYERLTLREPKHKEKLSARQWPAYERLAVASRHGQATRRLMFMT